MKRVAEVEFADYFFAAYNEVKRRKLGLYAFESVAPPASSNNDGGGGGGGDGNKGQQQQPLKAGADQVLWQELEVLMFHSQCDFTITFRELSKVAELFAKNSAAPGCENNTLLLETALAVLSPAFYDQQQVIIFSSQFKDVTVLVIT